MRAAYASITTVALPPAPIVPPTHWMTWLEAGRQLSPPLAPMLPAWRRLGPRSISRLTPLAAEPAICFAPVIGFEATTVVRFSTVTVNRTVSYTPVAQFPARMLDLLAVICGTRSGGPYCVIGGGFRVTICALA